MEKNSEHILRETLQQLIRIRKLMAEGYARSEEKKSIINEAISKAQLFEDDLFKRKAEKQSKVTIYVHAYGDGFSDPSEIKDLDPWINIYREYVQKFKIKHRLEKEGLWVQSNIEGEDEHLMIGSKDKPGEKVHAIIDGITGEVRLEVNEKNKQPHDLIEKIETILTMKTGEKIRSTRASLEFIDGRINPNMDTNIPILDIESSIGGTGGPNGDYVHFTIINISDKIAIDIRWGIRAFNYEWRSLSNPLILQPGERKRVEYRKDGERLHTEEVQELNIFIEYKNNAGQSFFTRRALLQHLTKGGVIYNFTVGDFHPAERLVDYGIKGIGVPIHKGDKYESEIEFEQNGIRKVVSISISKTFLSIWHFTSSEEVRSAITELGDRKVRKMLISNKIEDYCFITHDFPQDFQNGYEGYKKLRDSI